MNMSKKIMQNTLYDDPTVSYLMFNQEGFLTYADKKALSLLGNGATSKNVHCSHISNTLWRDISNVIATGRHNGGINLTINGSKMLCHQLPIKQGDSIIGVICLLKTSSQNNTSAYKLQLLRHVEDILESSSDGIYITDGQANTIMINSAYEKMTGIKREEVLGRNMKDLVTEGFYSESVTLKVLKTRKKQTLLQKLRNGKKLLVTGNPIFDDDGNIGMVVTNDRDISELIRLHDELEQIQGIAQAYKQTLHSMQQAAIFGRSFVVANKKMHEICDSVDRISRTDATVIFYGETGVGKDCLAEEIHKRSLRHDTGLFVKINCGAIPETLLESELFGYEGGSFTGASKEGKVGLFEVAMGGTILLDEVQCLPLSLQPKLLNVLQNFEITRVGGTVPRKIDVRIVCTANQNLKEMVAKNEFRADLYYRLDVISIEIPPLRERKEDIPPLIYHFLNHFNTKYGKKKTLSSKAIETMLNYPWPGNVREIANVIEKLVVITVCDTIRREDLPQEFFEKEMDLEQPVGNLKAYVEAAELSMIKRAVEIYGSARKAAPILGIDHSTITRKLQKKTESIQPDCSSNKGKDL